MCMMVPLVAATVKQAIHEHHWHLDWYEVTADAHCCGHCQLLSGPFRLVHVLAEDCFRLD
jgi:hypothetical protein